MRRPCGVPSKSVSQGAISYHALHIEPGPYGTCGVRVQPTTRRNIVVCLGVSSCLFKFIVAANLLLMQLL